MSSPPQAEDTQMHPDGKPQEMREVRPDGPTSLSDIEGHVREGAISPQQPDRPPREPRAPPDPRRDAGRGEREHLKPDSRDRDPRDGGPVRRDTAPVVGPHRQAEQEGSGKGPQRSKEAEDVALPLEDDFENGSDNEDFIMADPEALQQQQHALDRHNAEHQARVLRRWPAVHVSPPPGAEFDHSRNNPPVAGPRSRQPERQERHTQPSAFGYLVNGSFWSRETPKMTNAQIDELIHSHRQMVEHQRYSQQHADKLSNMVTRLEAELKQVREDLGASRAFVASETSVDARDLLQKLNDINEAVDDLVFNMLQYGDDGFTLETELEATLTEAMAKAALAAVDPTENKLLMTFSQYACSAKMTVGQYIQPVAQALLLHFLMGYVFVPFVPGQAPEDSKPIERLYRRIYESEPQDRAARWRAITYSRAYPKRDDNMTASTCARSFLVALNKVFYHLVPALQSKSPDPTDITWMESFEPTATVIVQDAIKWQDRTKTSHLSYDYSVMFTPEGLFDSWSMVLAEDDNEGPKKKKDGKEKELVVILCTGIGLQAVKNVVDSDGKTIKREMRIMIPAKVLAVRPPK